MKFMERLRWAIETSRGVGGPDPTFGRATSVAVDGRERQLRVVEGYS